MTPMLRAKFFLRNLPLLLSLVLLPPADATGDTPAQPVTVDSSPAAEADSSGTPDPAAWEAVAERIHTTTSTQVLALSRRLDSFFFDPATTQEANETKMRVRLGLKVSEGGEVDLLQRVYLRLDLPETERRLHLFLYEFDREDTPERAGEILAERHDEVKLGLNTGLRYAISGDRDENLQFLIGTRLYPKLDPFVEVRGRTSLPLGPLALHPAQYLYWRNDVGFGETTVLDTDFPLSASTRLRLRGEGTFSESSPGYEYRVSLSYAQQFRMKRGFLTGVEMAAHTRPTNDVDYYLASFTWRQRIHADWLFIEPAVQVRFPETDDYRPAPAILLQFEASFGREALFTETAAEETPHPAPTPVP